jgi:hypothetical protein
LHYNENSNRKQATTPDGMLRWAISYPKAFKGGKEVVKPIKEKPIYGKKSPPCEKDLTSRIMPVKYLFFNA